ncbi:MAG: hypothetical protein J0L56_04045 [Chitinophagales bacterium]|nr:hypothetical protein [Chitinophagales bacterium]
MLSSRLSLLHCLIVTGIAILIAACKAETVLTGKYSSKLYDEYVELKDNGRFKKYQYWFGIKPRLDGGMYLVSRDTVYLIYKRHKTLYARRDYFIIGGNALNYYHLDSANLLKQYSIWKNKLP